MYWHLGQGLGGAVENAVIAHSSCRRAVSCGPTRPIDERTRARQLAVHEIPAQGAGLLECGRRLGWALNTVTPYTRLAAAEHLQRPRRYGCTLVDPCGVWVPETTRSDADQVLHRRGVGA